MTKIQTKNYQDFEINIIPAFSDNYIFIIKCFKSGKTICVDPGDFKAADNFLKDNGLGLDFIIITHSHYDHVSGIEDLKEEYGCKVLVFEKDQLSVPGGDIFIKIDQKLSSKSITSLNVSHETIYNNDKIINQSRDVSRKTSKVKGEDVIYGDFKLGEILFTPFTTFGHCSNHVSYFIADKNILFCGDTLFSSGCGRVFADGSLEELYESLNKIKSLPKSTHIYCAHEYTLDNIEFSLTLEPKNQDLLRKKEDAILVRNNNKPTIPAILENELKINPFLRSNSIELRGNLEASDKDSDFNIFVATRKRKDSY